MVPLNHHQRKIQTVDPPTYPPTTLEKKKKRTNLLITDKLVNKGGKGRGGEKQ